MDTLIAVIAGLVVGGGLALGVRHLVATASKKRQQQQAQDILRNAQTEAEHIRREADLVAKAEALKLREETEKKFQETLGEIKEQERRLGKREDVIDRKLEATQRREKQLEQLEKGIKDKEAETDARRADLEGLIAKELLTLQGIAGLTKEDAARILMDKLKSELTDEMSGLVKKSLETARETADAEARKIVTIAIQRCAAEHTGATVVSTVDLPGEEMKGRIIGREGRNIRAFEKCAGVDVIVDDTPGVIVLSCFDSVRREMARRSMEKLIQDGRIHPARIEEVVEQTKKEIEETVLQTGKQACFDLGIHDLHPKLVTLLGRLRFRTSYGQNVLGHSMEVAMLCSSMAAELNLDPALAKRCGLLHDIGKAVDQEMEGSHPAIGVEVLTRFNERSEVIDSAGKHHEDMDANTPYTVLTAAADAISAARPGARMEILERYIKRLERLEEIASGFPGVDSSYAIHAGREVRVLVNAQKVDDKGAILLARDIAKEIEKERNYPGEIKVTLIREKRVVEYAR